MTVPPEEQDEPLAAELERELELALRAAWQPSALDPARHEQLIELALEDPLAAPSADEVVESERLRRALEGDGDHRHLALSLALSAATRPALPERGLPAPAPPAAAEPRGRVIYVAFGAVSAALAAAAVLVLVVGSLSKREAPAAMAPAPLASAAPRSAAALSRSSSALFQEPFTLQGTTARVDRIAGARERELRENRYLAWGVR